MALNYNWVNKTNDTKRVVLFLHEALGSIGQWKDFPELLCKELHLPGIVYERQGHGKSPALTEKRRSDYLHKYAWNELPSFLEPLISTFEIEEIILVGHSDGGTIALLHAAKFPEKIKAVITMAAHVINESETIAGIQPAVDAYQSGKLNGLRKYHGEKTETLFYAWADIWRSPAFKNWDITQDIKSICAPVLAIQGSDDQYGTIEQLELIAKNTNAETTLIEDCEHHPHLEKSNTCIELIRNFMLINGS